MLTRAAMAPTPAMQWKAVGRSIVTVLPVWAGLAVGAVRAVAAGCRLGLRLWLRAGDERGQALDVFVVGLLMLRPRLGMTLGVRLMLLAWIKRLRFARRERLAADCRLLVGLVIALVRDRAALVGALLVIGLALPKLFLGRGDEAKIVLGVLIVIFGRYRIARALCVTRKLQIFFRNVGRCTADFHVRSVGLVHARQRILVMTTLPVATAHSLVLTVSHDLFSRQPLAATARMPPSRSQSPIVSRQFDARSRSVRFVHDFRGGSCDFHV